MLAGEKQDVSPPVTVSAGRAAGNSHGSGQLTDCLHWGVDWACLNTKKSKSKQGLLLKLLWGRGLSQYPLHANSPHKARVPTACAAYSCKGPRGKRAWGHETWGQRHVGQPEQSVLGLHTS